MDDSLEKKCSINMYQAWDYMGPISSLVACRMGKWSIFFRSEIIFQTPSNSGDESKLNEMSGLTYQDRPRYTRCFSKVDQDISGLCPRSTKIHLAACDHKTHFCRRASPDLPGSSEPTRQGATLGVYHLERDFWNYEDIMRYHNLWYL